jgi:hypothetical protein
MLSKEREDESFFSGGSLYCSLGLSLRNTTFYGMIDRPVKQRKDEWLSSITGTILVLAPFRYGERKETHGP